MSRLPSPLLLAGLGLIAGLILATASPAQAGGLTVTGGKIDTTVKAGGSYSYVMEVGNTTEDPMDILVNCQGYGTTEDSICVNLSPTADIGFYSAREFLTVAPSSMHLDPGDSQKIAIDASIPADVSGGRYAVVNISTLPRGENISTVSAMSARVLLTIADTHLDHQSRINNLVQISPGHVGVTITHDGNHHYKPRLKGQLIKEGQILAEAWLDDDWPLIPGYNRQFELGFHGNELIPAGEYEVTLSLQDDSGNPVARQTTTLQMDAFDATAIPTTTPPAGSISEFSTVSIVLYPADTGFLATEDNKVEISFQAGSVIKRADLTLRQQPIIHLPPNNFESTGTSFLVDGLNGLLAKEAVIKVKYTNQDLKNAGGDAKRLVLARWDEALNQWTLIETSVDPETMTLTAATNQLGSLAVFILSSETSTRPVIIGIVSVIFISALAAALFLRRRSLHR